MPCIQVYSIATELEHRVTYDFPQPWGDCLSNISFWRATAPCIHDTTSTRPADVYTQGDPFYVPMSSTTLCLSVSIEHIVQTPNVLHPIPQDKSWTVFTPLAPLLAYSCSNSSSSSPISWDDWGPEFTRWFPVLPRQITRGSNGHGYSFILPDRILDFNPWAIRRDLTSSGGSIHNDPSQSSPGTTVVTEPTVIEKEYLWEEDVVSTLRYREVMCSDLEQLDCAGIIATGSERFLAIKVCQLGTSKASMLKLLAGVF